MRSASVGFQCPVCLKEGAATLRTPQAVYGGRAHTRPLVTQVLLGINVLAFLVTTASGTGVLFGGSPSKVFYRLALAPSIHPEFAGDQFVGFFDGVAQGQYYRLLTAVFLHFGIIHIALNMFCLYSLGPALELALGRVRFTVLYLLSGLAGSTLSYALGPEQMLAAGASGAVFGLFAAFFVVQRKRGGDVSAIAVTIGINLFISFAATFIDWRGHVGGLIGGAAVTAALVYAPAGKRRAVLQLAGAVGVAVVIGLGVVARTAALT